MKKYKQMLSTLYLIYSLIGFKGDQQLTPYTGNPDFHFLEFVN